MPNLLDGITLVIDFVVAPVTMVWFVVRWYRLVPNDSNHVRAVQATRQGDAHSIWVDPTTGHYWGAEDRRINGKAAGY